MTAAAAAYLAIDGDGHVIEDEALFERYLPPQFRAAAPGPKLNAANARRFVYAGAEHPPFPPEISIRKPMAAADRITLLDKERIAAAMLYPSGVLVGLYALGPEAARALAESYLEWIADYCAPHPTRLFFAAPLALDDPAWAARQAQRAVARGARAVCVRPNRKPGRRWDEAALDPLYAAIAETGVPLVFHETTGDPDTAAGDRYGIGRPEAYAFSHVISHPFEQMFAAMSVLCGGVLERHPRLTVGFAEAGCSWVPYWLARLDAHFAHRVLGRQMPIRMKPAEYFRRQCFVTCDPDDATLPLAIAGLGADAILFATDYPHFDSAGGAVGTFLDIPGVSAADRRKILWENAARIYGIAP
jgi:predicted TIM-barrel fold metal-dependent hydrolase